MFVFCTCPLLQLWVSLHILHIDVCVLYMSSFCRCGCPCISYILMFVFCTCPLLQVWVSLHILHIDVCVLYMSSFCRCGCPCLLPAIVCVHVTSRRQAPVDIREGASYSSATSSLSCMISSRLKKYVHSINFIFVKMKD